VALHLGLCSTAGVGVEMGGCVCFHLTHAFLITVRCLFLFKNISLLLWFSTSERAMCDFANLIKVELLVVSYMFILQPMQLEKHKHVKP
jgi:hypothetical protein